MISDLFFSGGRFPSIGRLVRKALEPYCSIWYRATLSFALIAQFLSWTALFQGGVVGVVSVHHLERRFSSEGCLVSI